MIKRIYTNAHAQMVQHPIFESDAKSILRRNLKTECATILPNIVVEDTENLEKLPEFYPWLLENRLVVKPDQVIKGRGVAGLVGIDLSFAETAHWIRAHFGKEHLVGVGNFAQKDKLKRFIIEPFISHAKESEHFLCFRGCKNGDFIIYSNKGGIDIGDVNSHSTKIFVNILEDLTHYHILNNFKYKIFDEFPILADLIIELFKNYRNLHFSYLEFNPLIIHREDNRIYFVDVAAKIDTCADFICEKNWGLCGLPPTFGRGMSEAERHIADLDAKSGASLKFVLLNPEGRIWTMIAGGGASVVFADTICDLGFSKELANYGEYSGAPTYDETYEYSKVILNLMTSSSKGSSGKILIIGGGIANFTNVAVTFKGIISAIKDYASKLAEHNVRIFVRRGGPNYEEGLKNIKKACESLGIEAHVFGIEIHMTSILSMALGLKPIKDTIEFTVSKTVSFPSKSVMGSFDADTPSLMVTQPLTAQNLNLFENSTTAVLWGFQEVAIQGMLDFDYLCKRETPSVACMIYPFRASIISKFYFGLKEILIPIYGTFKEATEKFPQASVLINFASMRSSFEVSLEALQYPQFKTISIFAEGVPERQTQILNNLALKNNVIIVGPASVGGIKPGHFRIAHSGGNITNIVSSKLYRPGSVCYITRSGGMSNELNNILSRVTDGVLEGIHLGGDRYPGTSYMDHINRFISYPGLELIVLLGEVGGLEEYSVCEALRDKKIHVPVVAWCIGTCSSYFSSNIQFGHANACADIDAETAAAKNAALKAAGALVPQCFDELYSLILNIYNDRVRAGIWKVKPDALPPPIPVDYKHAREMGLIRKPASFISTICDDRGNEPTYSGVPISQILDENLGIGGTIGLLWFQRVLPDYMRKFFEMCVIILADHGPAVSGAHNTIVTTRAGKDMLSSLCSGLLTIGDRFGGAINGAASQFWSAYSSKKQPAEFVSDMRKKGQLILGIGHLIKSVTNPDERVKKIVGYVRSCQPTPLLDYALEVEKITTSKVYFFNFRNLI